jgi:hypothetical protein
MLLPEKRLPPGLILPIKAQARRPLLTADGRGRQGGAGGILNANDAAVSVITTCRWQHG